jgi:hypothetical protein
VNPDIDLWLGALNDPTHRPWSHPPEPTSQMYAMAWDLDGGGERLILEVEVLELKS